LWLSLRSHTPAKRKPPTIPPVAAPAVEAHPPPIAPPPEEPATAPTVAPATAVVHAPATVRRRSAAPASAAAPAPPTAPPPVDRSLAMLKERLDAARALSQDGQIIPARALLEELSKDARIRPQAQLALGELEYRGGHYRQAIRHTSDAIELGVGNEAYLLRAAAEMRAGELTSAQHDFQAVLAREPDNAEARGGLARVEEQLRRSPR
jgi:predicted Zn-dependent protease